MRPADELRAAAETLRMNPKALREAAEEVAELLSPWLDATADEYDREPCDDPTGVCNRCEFDPSVLPALTLAAAITGSTS